jgi:acyl carrier protein
MVVLSKSCLTQRIRAVIDNHAQLPRKCDTLSDSASLYDAGMTSLASVSLMLALEDEFGIEFPDHMLRRDVFESVSSIREALDLVINSAI